MRIQELSNNSVIFRSGYPTFGTNGHLNEKPEIAELIGRYFKPTGRLEKPVEGKLDYYA